MSAGRMCNLPANTKTCMANNQNHTFVECEITTIKYKCTHPTNVSVYRSNTHLRPIVFDMIVDLLQAISSRQCSFVRLRLGR